MSLGKVLAIDDERNIQHLIKSEFSLEGFDVATAGTGEEGLRLFDEHPFDLVLLDMKLPKLNGLETLKQLKQKASSVEVIMITGHGEVESAVESIKLGARDYITKPFKLDELILLAKEAIADQQSFQCAPLSKSCLENGEKFILCPSADMQKIYQALSRVAATEKTVLIQGETGVGKDVLAMQLHLNSTRKQGPFITLDCGMLNQNLAESELYGHRKGAFSGATEPKKGLVEKSHDGTLFLDEIGNIDLELQKKFLRFLETGRFRRVGETREIHVNSRIVLATNVDLQEAVQKGMLRKDLLYRMDIISFDIPPLRDRPEDIAALALKILDGYREEIRPMTVTPEAMDILKRYTWPGNIRELKSVITKAVLFADSDLITPDDLPSHLRSQPAIHAKAPRTLVEMEIEHIRKVLQETGGNQTKAAEVLGINRKTLYKKIHKYEIF
jgi:DNA-binding NtrC family response regulator